MQCFSNSICHHSKVPANSSSVPSLHNIPAFSPSACAPLCLCPPLPLPPSAFAPLCLCPPLPVPHSTWAPQYFSRPIRRLHEAATMLADRDFSARVTKRRGCCCSDEIDDLHGVFNFMAEEVAHGYHNLEENVSERCSLSARLHLSVTACSCRSWQTCRVCGIMM